jgi:hypothetical protein
MSDTNPRASIKLPSDFVFGNFARIILAHPTHAATAAWSTLRICWRLGRERLQHHLSAR